MTLIWTDFILFGSSIIVLFFSDSLVLAPKGYFETTQCPSRATTSPRAVVVKLQSYKDTIRCVMQGAEVPRLHQRQLNHTLILRVKKHSLLPY